MIVSSVNNGNERGISAEQIVSTVTRSFEGKMYFRKYNDRCKFESSRGMDPTSDSDELITLIWFDMASLRLFNLNLVTITWFSKVYKVVEFNVRVV